MYYSPIFSLFLLISSCHTIVYSYIRPIFSCFYTVLTLKNGVICFFKFKLALRLDFIFAYALNYEF